MSSMLLKNVKKDWQLALQTLDNVEELRYNIGHANCQTIMTYYAVNNIASGDQYHIASRN